MIKEALELLSKYGAKNLFFICAIVYLYLSIQKNEKKLEVIEAKLYDCYEDKILIQRSAQTPIENYYPLLAILPNEKTNIRHARSKRNV